MTPKQHEKAMQVFNEAVGLAVEERAVFVDDAVVKTEVDPLCGPFVRWTTGGARGPHRV